MQRRRALQCHVERAPPSAAFVAAETHLGLQHLGYGAPVTQSLLVDDPTLEYLTRGGSIDT
jgi:hypothetical protein